MLLQILASAAADRSVRVWEVATARCLDAWTAEDPIADLAWCPRPDCHVVAVAAGAATLERVWDERSV